MPDGVHKFSLMEILVQPIVETRYRLLQDDEYDEEKDKRHVWTHEGEIAAIDERERVR